MYLCLPFALNKKLVETALIAPYNYCKVASKNMSWSVAHPGIFRLFMKGKMDNHVL